MSILFLTKGDRSVGSSRQRVWRLADHLKRSYGYESTVLCDIKYSFWDIGRKRWRMTLRVIQELFFGHHDIIFVHKALFPIDIVLCVRIVGTFGKKIIFDLDDAEWRHSRLKSIMLAKSARVIFAGSHPILEWAKKYNTNTVLVPTVVDDEIYKTCTVIQSTRSIPTIGWVGVGRAHFQDGHFIILKNVFGRLYTSGVHFRFVIIGSQGYRPLKEFFKDVPYEVIFVDELEWKDATSVPRAIHEYVFDVGVMPTSDTPFNRAKCAFKAIEYMGCGVPTIASHVGEAIVLIQDGTNGFLAGDKDEWFLRLRQLLEDPSLRARIGERAQQRIRDHYSYRAFLPTINNELKALLKY